MVLQRKVRGVPNFKFLPPHRAGAITMTMHGNHAFKQISISLCFYHTCYLPWIIAPEEERHCMKVRVDNRLHYSTPPKGGTWGAGRTVEPNGPKIENFQIFNLFFVSKIAQEFTQNGLKCPTATGHQNFGFFFHPEHPKWSKRPKIQTFC